MRYGVTIATMKLADQFADAHTEDAMPTAELGTSSGNISHGILPRPSPKPATNKARQPTIRIGAALKIGRIAAAKAKTPIVNCAAKSKGLLPSLSIIVDETIVMTKLILATSRLNLIAVSDE